MTDESAIAARILRDPKFEDLLDELLDDQRAFVAEDSTSYRETALLVGLRRERDATRARVSDND